MQLKYSKNHFGVHGKKSMLWSLILIKFCLHILLWYVQCVIKVWLYVHCQNSCIIMQYYVDEYCFCLTSCSLVACQRIFHLHHYGSWRQLCSSNTVNFYQVTTHKTVLFIITAIRMSDHTIMLLSLLTNIVSGEKSVRWTKTILCKVLSWQICYISFMFNDGYQLFSTPTIDIILP